MRWLFSLLFFVPLFATEVEMKDLPLANQGSGISAIVNGTVNVISGHYLEHAADLAIVCPEDFNFERHYCSKDFGLNSLYHSWSHNWWSYILKDPNTGKRNAKYYMYDKLGSWLTFSKPAYDSKINKYVIPFRAEDNKGVSNLGGGVLSARTNMKNGAILPEGKTNHYLMPDGTKRTYKHTSLGDFLAKEVKPSGNEITYSFDNGRLKTIELFNQDGEKMAWFSIEKANNEHFNLHPYIEIVSSDQRIIRYNFLNRKNKKDKRFYLNKVIRGGRTIEGYEYDFFQKDSPDGRITYKTWPEGQFLINEYYSSGDNDIVGVSLVIPKGDIREHRIRKQKAPLGSDGTPVTAYQFVYCPNKAKNDEGGTTYVYDALGNLAKYIYDTNHRLLQIAKPGQIERFHWGSGQNEGNLVDHFFDDSSSGNVLFSRHYSYDDRGNVLKDTFRGNITGLRVEEFSQHYTYSDDGFNLMLTLDNGLEQHQYQYVPGTNLLAAKFILVNKQIVCREFYEYDRSSCLLCQIKDDGTSLEKDDLAGVTVRTITRYVRKNSIPCWGVPLVIEESYLDLVSGQECLLKKLVQDFDGYGRMLSQKVYGSDGQYAYTHTWAYNDIGDVIREVDALGNVIVRQFDENRNMLEEESLSSGFKKICCYDRCNRKIRENIQTPGGEVLGSAFQYNYLSQCIAEYDVCGNPTLMQVDYHGNILAKNYPDGSKETFVYDSAGNQIAAANQRGLTIHKQYNARGQPVYITYPDGTAESYIYNLWGAVVSHTAKNGTVTKYTRDHQHRILSETVYDASGTCLKTTANTYNALHLLNSIDPEGNVTSYDYDFAGRLIRVSKHDEVTEYAYDTLGRQHKITNYTADQEAAVTCYEFDSLDRKIEERLEDLQGNVLKKVCYLYDARGNQTQEIKHTAAGLAITKTEYNLFNQPTLITDSLGHTKHIAYNYKHKDANGLYVQQHIETDPLGQQTITTFDAMGRVASIVKKNSINYELAKVEKQYDPCGNCIASIDTIYSKNGPRIVKNCWEYDSLNRVITQIEASGLPEQKITRYAYNANGERETIVKPDGIVLTHTYNALGLLQALASSDGSIHYQYTYSPSGLPLQVDDLVNNTVTTRTYYKGRLQQETLGNGLAIGYEYDRIGRPTKVIFPDQTVVEYTYDACYLRQITRNGLAHHYKTYDLSGNLLEEQCFNGNALATSYDLLGRALSTPLQSGICYDQAGNLISYQQEGEVLNFGYDDLYQLNKEKDHAYQFDSLHNRVSKDEENFTYNGLNQIVSDDLEYDFNGNLIRQGSTHYTYDALDRLIKVSGKTATTYCYDSFNRRLSKTQEAASLLESGKDKITTFFYQGQDETGACQEGKIVNLRLIGRGKGAEIGASVLLEIDQTPYIPIHNHIGSIIRIVDLKGCTVESYSYTAYGEETVTNYKGSPCKPINPWRFSSKRTDEETGLVYFGRRYYSPQFARWVTADPIGFEGGPNLYAYVLNNPLMRVDLYGLYPESGHKPAFHFGPRHFKASSYFIGKAVEYLCHHLIPIPIVNDICSGIGRVMAGEGFSMHTGDYSPSYTSVMPGSSSYTKHAWCNVNGMNNVEDDAKYNARYLQGQFGGVVCNNVYSSTCGVFADIFGAFLQKLGIEFPCTGQLRNLITGLIGNVGGTKSDGTVTVTCFSRGGIVTHNATKDMSDDEKQMLHIATFGSAKMIPNDKYGSVTNYVSLLDPVPFLCDPIGILMGIFTDKVNIEFLWPSGEDYCDHKLVAKTYEAAIQKEARKFHERARK